MVRYVGFLSFVAACFTFLIPSAQADLPGFSGMNDILNDYRRNEAYNQQQLTGRPAYGPPPVSQQPVVPAQNLLPITATDFKGSDKRVILDQVSSIPGLTTAQQEQTRQFYRGTLDAFERVARKNNLASAYTYLLRVCLEISTGTPMPDATAVQLLLNLDKALGNSPEFRAMDTRQRQLTYETAITTAGWMTTLFHSNDLASKLQARQTAAAILATHGVK